MNKHDLRKVLTFVAGAVIGSSMTWYFTKKHYDQIMEDEFESMKEYFERKEIERKEKELGELKDAVEEFKYTAQEMADKNHEKPSIAEYASKIKDSDYVDYTAKSGNNDKSEKSVPYVISPEEIENGEYNLQTLTYYSDGVLVDDWNDKENYADDLAGSEFEEHFGDHVDDVVHVRNDELQIDYEITRDPRNYSDIVNPDQYDAEDE